MIAFDRTEIRRLLPWPRLVESLRHMFSVGCEAPLRHHHEVAIPGAESGTLLLMPAWRSGHYIGVKVVNVFPGNVHHGLPTVSGLYILANGKTGEVIAQFDGGELTARRTAGTSALAAAYLARRDARHLLVIGTGRVCRNLPAAYRAVRSIERVSVYSRNIEKAKDFIQTQAAADLPGVTFDVATDLPAALRQADIVTSATVATAPIITGADLPAGIHVDLIGGYRPDMREADDETMRRASAVFVDTREGASKEAGDLVQPIAGGVLTERSIVADLSDLCRERHPGRTRDEDITVFKSVGAAIEDLAAAVAAFESKSLQQSAGP